MFTQPYQSQQRYVPAPAPAAPMPSPVPSPHRTLAPGRLTAVNASGDTLSLRAHTQI